MKSILFIDKVCPKQYDQTTLGGPNQGGTESTVTKIALGLRSSGLFNVSVEQHNRTEANDLFIPLGVTQKADYVIVLRDPYSVIEARRRFPNNKIYLWSHDLATQQLGQALQVLIDNRIEANITTSQFHKTQTIERLKSHGYNGQFATQMVYSPIDDDLRPDNTPYDPNQLCFISSPHKGLEYALQVFSNLLNFNPDFKLMVANPGYFADRAVQQPGVVVQGSLPHGRVIDLLRGSLCLFYPNLVFPETFGLVMAEANAVGTPVLAHAIGASYEVCDIPAIEVIDCSQPKPVIDQVMNWYKYGRPTVRGKSQFRLANVLKTWIKEILQ